MTNRLNRPIFVIGAPRSGTSLLARVLGYHPDVYYLAEPRLTWRYGNDRRSDMLSDKRASEAAIRHIRREFGRRVREAGRSRLLEKTPSNALRMPFIDKVFPDACYVHIIRNGYETALSIRSRWLTHAHGFGIKKEFIRRRISEIKVRQIPFYVHEVFLRLLKRRGVVMGGRGNVWGPRLPGIAGMVRDLDLLDVSCLQWRMCVEAACNFGRKLDEDRYMECRLEDLDSAMLETIISFTGLPPHEAIAAEFRREFDPTATNHRRERADPEDIRRIREWIEPTMLWLAATSQAPTAPMPF